MNDQKISIEEIIQNLGDSINFVESFPDKKGPYLRLYTDLKMAIPHLSKIRKKGILYKTIIGKLEDKYLIRQSSMLGYKSIAIKDISNNKFYAIHRDWLDEDIRFSAVINLNPETIIHETYF